MQAFQKPENALARADELLSVGQEDNALTVLQQTIGHRKFRMQGWDITCEEIMMKYVRLCVDLQRMRQAREGLHLYRNITQQQNIASLGKVMRELRDYAESKLTQIKEANEQTAAQIDDDLEADETPESLMLSTLQVEVRDQAAKELHQAMVVCWESYKLIMDLLRFAPKLEMLYHETAQKALEFCRLNQRPQEFRRLCETLRLHYAFFRSKTKPDLEAYLNPESHLITRLHQLVVASELGMWSQCFQTAEDIVNLGLHDLLQRYLVTKDPSKAKFKAQLLQHMATYYEKLGQIFWVSENYLFHAQASLRGLMHARQYKRVTSPVEQTQMSNATVLAVLAIPLLAQESKDRDPTQDLEYKRRFSSIMGHGGIPSKESLKEVLLSRGILNACSPPVRDIFHIVEKDIIPLKLCAEAQPVLTEIAKDEQLARYVQPIKRVIFHKLMQQLSRVYSSMSVEYFSNNICPEEFFAWPEAEKVVVNLVRKGHLDLRLDYSKKAIYFGSALAGPEVALKSHLFDLGRVLSAIVPKLDTCRMTPKHVVARERFYATIGKALEAEAKRLEGRNEKVTERWKLQKQEQEQLEADRRNREKEKQRKEEQEEAERRGLVLRRREEQRKREERERQKRQLAEDLLREFRVVAEKAPARSLTVNGKAVEELTVEDILGGRVTLESFEKLQEELRIRERQERIRQRKQEAKRVEHLVRALRDEEMKLLDKWREETKEKDEQLVKQLQIDFEAKALAEFEQWQVVKKAFLKVETLKDAWVKERLAERQQQLAVLEKKRIARVKQALKKQKIANARSRKAEEDRKAQEEERKRKAQQEAEAEEKRRLALEKQLKAEEEAEARIREEAERLEKEGRLGMSRGGPGLARGPPRGERIGIERSGLGGIGKPPVNDNIDFGMLRRGGAPRPAPAAPIIPERAAAAATKVDDWQDVGPRGAKRQGHRPAPSNATMEGSWRN